MLYSIEPVKSPQEWRTYFDNIGLKEEYIEIYLQIIEELYRKKNPIIFEIEHFSKLVGVEVTVLLSMIFSKEKFYRQFKIPKKKGGERTITVPSPSLMLVQKWIYNYILINKKIHYSAHGFNFNRSIITNAKMHVGNKAFLKIDLKDFFPSIPIGWIVNYFKQQGYPPKISFYLASLCTLKDSLPQGAPTSPILSNIIFYNLDKVLYKFSKKNALTYTRYADDLVFSGKYISLKFRNFVIFLIRKYGFQINSKKTSLKVNAGQNIITGILVKDTIFVPKKYKRKLRQEMFYIKKFGLLSHIATTNIRDPNYVYSLMGRLNFVLTVEPENEEFIEYQNYIKRILKKAD
ncbi:RNA-directed DNA polymerase [Acinetobacter wuhouensis]|uniref:reverse transcriptase family protein n=1 Tax=Acinetobacter wuhouensis TaxID=1879050 RepID=UPI00083A0FC7|nr:reverse transcriptase family protein [Acinetobacter wuhouensis]AXQ23142.1 RNA-directed DNA polymerase [Acinetobacter wuhouensis]